MDCPCKPSPSFTARENWTQPCCPTDKLALAILCTWINVQSIPLPVPSHACVFTASHRTVMHGSVVCVLPDASVYTLSPLCNDGACPCGRFAFAKYIWGNSVQPNFIIAGAPRSMPGVGEWMVASGWVSLTDGHYRLLNRATLIHHTSHSSQLLAKPLVLQGNTYITSYIMPMSVSFNGVSSELLTPRMWVVMLRGGNYCCHHSNQRMLNNMLYWCRIDVFPLTMRRDAKEVSVVLLFETWSRCWSDFTK